MPPQYLRAYCERAADTAAAEPGTPIRFVASTEGVARDGMIIEAAGWNLENYQRNPVFLWAHDMLGARPPIGRVAKVFTQKKQLLADVVFDQEDEFARAVESKYRNGFLNAVSVSWDTREFAPPKGPNQAPRITKAELLEISAVPIPSDPNALAARQARALHDLAGEIEALASEQTSDPDPDPIPDPKSNHQRAQAPEPDDDAWEDAAAAMAKLYLPGMRLTERERRREYHTLSKQYRLANRETPEWIALDDLAAYTLAEIRGLFLEGEPDLFPELFRSSVPGQRAGAMLSKRNEDDLTQARSLIDAVLQRAKKEAEQSQQEAENEPERGQGLDTALTELLALSQ